MRLLKGLGSSVRKLFEAGNNFLLLSFTFPGFPGQKTRATGQGSEIYFYLDYVELLRYEKVLQRGSSPLKFSSECSKAYVSSTAPPRDVMVL